MTFSWGLVWTCMHIPLHIAQFMNSCMQRIQKYRYCAERGDGILLRKLAKIGVIIFNLPP